MYKHNSSVLPDFLQSEYKAVLLTLENFEKFHKLIHFNLKLMKYITVYLYGYSKLSNFNKNKIYKFIADNFQIPTEGTWFKLLKILLEIDSDAIKKIKKILENNIAAKGTKEFITLFYYHIQGKINLSESLKIITFFEKTVTLKNKYISHNIIPSSIAEEFISKMIPITEEVIQIVSSIFNVPIYQVKEYSTQNEIISNLIWGSGTKKINKEILNEQLINDGIYLKIKRNIIFLYPFLICRDGKILLYNKYISREERIYFLGDSLREIYIKTNAKNVSEIFNFDPDILALRPITVNVKLSSNRTTHNLPSKDYIEFIGRKKELKQLEEYVNHPRLFITALDGIGGVGKSAITLEFCHKLTDDVNERTFEYIIWLSAKTTILVNGKIKNLENSFQHLEQLLDVILEVIGFVEYKNYDHKSKLDIVNQILKETTILLVIDNLETLARDKLQAIWDFITDKLPYPSKVILTSREYRQGVPLSLRLGALNYEDTEVFIDTYARNKTFKDDTKSIIANNKRKIIGLSSGLPLAITSILGQLYLGSTLKSIQKGIEKNQDDLTKFCFEEQLRCLKDDHKKILYLICLSSESLNYDALNYILENEIESNINDILIDLNNISIINIKREDDTDFYQILPLVKKYIMIFFVDPYLTEHLSQKLTNYYQLKTTDSYPLFAYEELMIPKGELIPRKLADLAMHEAGTSIKKAEDRLKNTINEYPNETYVWYLYSIFSSKYKNDYKMAIEQLKKANELQPSFIFYQKIGYCNLKLKNYDAAFENYHLAQEYAKMKEHKNEIDFFLGDAYYKKARDIRRSLTQFYEKDRSKIREKNESFLKSITHFEKYIKNEPLHNERRKPYIYRCLAEAYHTSRLYYKALDNINITIQLTKDTIEQEHHEEFKEIILESINSQKK